MMRDRVRDRKRGGSGLRTILTDVCNLCYFILFFVPEEMIDESFAIFVE